MLSDVGSDNFMLSDVSYDNYTPSYVGSDNYKQLPCHYSLGAIGVGFRSVSHKKQYIPKKFNIVNH